ncbi:MAG: AAA family ATPase [Rickettsiales bacterium]
MDNKEKPERQIKLLVGTCGVGKSHYVCTHKQEHKGYVIISFDDILEGLRKDISHGSGYTPSHDEVYYNKRYVIESRFVDTLKKAIRSGDNIIVDTSNYSSKSRAVILSIAKDSDKYDYKSTAVVIHPPSEEEHVKRLLFRSMVDKRFGTINTVNLREVEPIQEGEFDNVEYVGRKQKNKLFHEYEKPVSLVETIRDAKNLGGGGINK